MMRSFKISGMASHPPFYVNIDENICKEAGLDDLKWVNTQDEGTWEHIAYAEHLDITIPSMDQVRSAQAEGESLFETLATLIYKQAEIMFKPRTRSTSSYAVLDDRPTAPSAPPPAASAQDRRDPRQMIHDGGQTTFLDIDDIDSDQEDQPQTKPSAPPPSLIAGPPQKRGISKIVFPESATRHPTQDADVPPPLPLTHVIVGVKTTTTATRSDEMRITPASPAHTTPLLLRRSTATPSAPPPSSPPAPPPLVQPATSDIGRTPASPAPTSPLLLPRGTATPSSQARDDTPVAGSGARQVRKLRSSGAGPLHKGASEGSAPPPSSPPAPPQPTTPGQPGRAADEVLHPASSDDEEHKKTPSGVVAVGSPLRAMRAMRPRILERSPLLPPNSPPPKDETDRAPTTSPSSPSLKRIEDQKKGPERR